MDGYNIQKRLNTLLKGEQIAVESYGRFISAVNKEDIKSEFQSIREQHKRNTAKLADRIRSVGGSPDPKTGITGVVASTRLSMQTGNVDNPFELLKLAYDGEDRVIEAAEEVVLGGLDTESRKLVTDILDQDHRNLEAMLSLMSEYGHLQ